jgi:hypothetical protein
MAAVLDLSDLQSEADFVARVNDWATLAGFRLQFSLTVAKKSMTGWPDRVYLDPDRGRLLIVEFKDNRGRLRPRLLKATRRGFSLLWGQDDWIRGLSWAGVFAAVWRPRDADRVQATLFADDATWERLRLEEMARWSDHRVPPNDAPATLYRPRRGVA